MLARRWPQKRCANTARGDAGAVLAVGRGYAYGRSAFRPWTDARMRAILWLIDTILWLYVCLLIAQAVLSWLLAFGVINRYNQTVSVIGDFLYRITEPALRPIRSILPNFGGLDISPVILILIIYFLRILITEDLAPILYRIAP
jgi:YggT family protein